MRDAILYISDFNKTFEINCKTRMLDHVVNAVSEEFKYIDLEISDIDSEALLCLNKLSIHDCRYFDIKIDKDSWVLAEANVKSFKGNKLTLRSKRIILSEG